MAAVSRIEAQQRVDDIRVFEREFERLAREQVLQLSDAQRSALVAHHQRLLARYAATAAFGRRFEPWALAVSAIDDRKAQ